MKDVRPEFDIREDIKKLPTRYQQVGNYVAFDNKIEYCRIKARLLAVST